MMIMMRLLLLLGVVLHHDDNPRSRRWIQHQLPALDRCCCWLSWCMLKEIEYIVRSRLVEEVV